MNAKVRPLYVVLKALCLFVLINSAYALLDPHVAAISAYNKYFPGRLRMPFGEDLEAYTLTVENVDTLFAAHAISREKEPNEIRVALVGDSAIWGDNLSVSETLSEQWNQFGFQCGGKVIKVYNLGYPHPSVIKDLLFLDKTMENEPDLVIWFITLNTLNQYRLSPLLTENRERTINILDTYGVSFGPKKALVETRESFYQKTLVGQRSFLARLIKLQFLGMLWSATAKDSYGVPDPEDVISPDVKKDVHYRGMAPGSDLGQVILLDALAAGHEIIYAIPTLLVNEPIYAATGANSDLRYNDLYPRWAYDQYREVIAAQAKNFSWNYLDLWDVIPPEYFSNTPLHLTAHGELLLIEQLNPVVYSLACP